jgi:hypothetical protein
MDRILSYFKHTTPTIESVSPTQTDQKDQKDQKDDQKFEHVMDSTRLSIQSGCACACSIPVSSNVFFVGTGYGGAKRLNDQEFDQCVKRCVRESVPSVGSFMQKP